MQKSNNFKKILSDYKKRQRLGVHKFHRYFGKLIPAIPGFAIDTFTKEGDTVLDSFCGSGTTLVEAKQKNRNAYGVDINPLSVFLSEIKISKIDIPNLLIDFNLIKNKIRHGSVQNYNLPYVVNMDHWFKSFVKKDLLEIRASILDLNDGPNKNFFWGCFSAFLRGVSNADPRHIFPGYSKRLRALDKQGLRKIKVIDSFGKAVLRRISYLEKLSTNKAFVKALVGDSKKLPKVIKNIDLVVTNPPYISSIRYLETMKLEMGWLGFINGQEDYLSLDKKVVGTERFYKRDLVQFEKTNIPVIDKQVLRLIDKNQKKMAKVVSVYFNDMQKSISEMTRVLNKGGYLVFKISDSQVRGENIETHKHFTYISEKYGMKLIASFKDDINKNSRSLLIKRNTYSGIINHDWILIFEKI